MRAGRGWAVCALAAALAAGTGACGGNDDGAASEPVTYSAAAESPRAFAKRMAKLLATAKGPQDCVELQAISNRSLTRFECPPGKELGKSMANFQLVGAGEYGTGGVIDYKSGEAKDGAALVLFVGPDRNWAISRFGVVTEPSTDTSDKDSRAGFREAVAAYLDAIRTRDCAAFNAAAFTGEPDKKVCRTLFPGTKKFARRLKSNPGASPTYEGGNRTYGFFTLETAKPDPLNLTISVVRANPGSDNPYLVLDVAESPTAAQQREAIRALKRSEKQGDGTDTSPSPAAPAPAP